MNFARRNVGCRAAGWLAGLCLVLAAGCASSSSSQKVYDRYAELVAQRNQPGVAAAPAARPADKPAAPAPATARKPDPQPAPAPAAKPPAPAPSQPAAAVAPKPAPEPAAAPVQLIPPKPAEKAPAPAPAPVPAPVEVATPAPAPAASVPALADAGYRPKVGDGIQIFLRGIPGGEAIEDVIDEAGMITLPFINEILAAGLTASELERNVRQTYLDQDIYRNITVNVVVPTRYY